MLLNWHKNSIILYYTNKDLQWTKYSWFLFKNFIKLFMRYIAKFPFLQLLCGIFFAFAFCAFFWHYFMHLIPEMICQLLIFVRIIWQYSSHTDFSILALRNY